MLWASPASEMAADSSDSSREQDFTDRAQFGGAGARCGVGEDEGAAAYEEGISTADDDDDEEEEMEMDMFDGTKVVR